MSKLWKVGLALLAVAVLYGIWHWTYRREITVPPAALPIDRETTYLTEPLGSDGRVDYEAALNATPLPPPEQNAALPILEAVGAAALLGDAAQSLVRLGARSDLPMDGLLVPYPGELPYLDKEEGPLPNEEQAAVRAWLEANQAALDALLEASLRPQLAWPLTRDGDSGMLQLALSWETWQQLLSLLQMRADLHLPDGKLPSGWSDIQVELRLSKLLGQQPLIFCRLFETGLRFHAQQWVGRALSSETLDEAACREMRETLEALPRLLRCLAVDCSAF